VASATFHELDHYMTTRELRYAKRMHPTKSYAWRKARYWGKHNPQKGDTWVFGSEQTGSHLLLFRWFKIERHVLVAGTSSPDDPRLRDYWERRKAARAKDLRPSLQRIARNQGHVCRRCGETLFNGEDIHKHHITPRAEGGEDRYDNLEMVHLYCHQQIHGSTPETIDVPTHEPTRSWLRTWFT